MADNPQIRVNITAEERKSLKLDALDNDTSPAQILGDLVRAHLRGWNMGPPPDRDIKDDPI